MNSYVLEPVGFIRSRVKGREDAPRQGPEGAPDAWLEIEPRFAEALLGMEVGHELIVITWLHQARRDVELIDSVIARGAALREQLLPFCAR